MQKRFEQFWKSTTIKKKILFLTGAVTLMFALSVLFNLWVVKFSLIDFNSILDSNTKSIRLVEAFEKEEQMFCNYVQNQGVTIEMLSEAMKETKKAVESIPTRYEELGEIRYAQTGAINKSYKVYVERRDAFLEAGKGNPFYIRDLYKLYDMQAYLVLYAKNLMVETQEAGDLIYQERVAGLMKVPFAVIAVGFVLVLLVMKLGQMLNKTIVGPVMELVGMSKRIARNDFYVEDIHVDTQDELGELVHAFNKMKYATGEYISALEEKRKTLDLLHEEELEKLEMENRLERMKLDLLKSQVNPHFLFNTLNVIAGMANLEEAETTEKMIRSLSSLFRYNLRTDDIEVPLSRELMVVEDYMYLQQMRFGDRLTYDVDCRVDKERVLVPAFTFQPLVENAIIHGLSKKEEEGRIRIRIWMKEQKLYIYIGDTGIGMSEDALDILREKLRKEKEQSGQGIGLGNICRRIYAMYTNGSVEIYSKANVGTVVKVVIPQ